MDQLVHWCQARSPLLETQGSYPSNKGGETTVSESWPNPQEMLQDSHTERWDTEAFCQEAAFICAGTGSVDSRPNAEP